MLNSVALVDPIATGHHLDYAIKLAIGLKERGVKLYAIGSQAFIEGISLHVQIDKYEIISFQPSNRVSMEFSKLTFAKKALRFAHELDADLVHFLYLDRFIFSLFFCSGNIEFPINRIQATLHWAYFLKEFVPDRLRQMKCKMEVYALKKLVQKGMRVMVHSRSLVSRLESLTDKNAFDYVPYPTSIPNMEDEASKERRHDIRAKLGILDTDCLLLVFGGTRFDKGSDLAVRALYHLPDNFHLLIAGQEEYFREEQLLGIAKENGVEHRLHLDLRFIPENQMNNFFSSSDIVFLPYRKIFAGQSGPLTLAAASGITVVASDVAVLKETVETYNLGSIFPSENQKTMVEAILKVDLLKNDARVNDFSKDHSIESFVQKVYENYVHSSTIG